ncbi:hypothetical protein AMTRI_Chr05g60110 [Amborella trichopoda]
MKSVIIYIFVALFLLFLIHYGPNKSQTSRSLHRRVGPARLKLRSKFSFSSRDRKHDPVAFDPFVAEIERHREDREWEKKLIEQNYHELNHSIAPGEESQPEWEDFMNAEDYLNDEERFNVTSRLVLLFPRIDIAPADGFLSTEELTQWNLQQSFREVMHRTERDMELHDKNRDGFVSFAEYDPPSWARHADNNSYGYEIGWWKEDHFNSSDEDGDGLLNRTEFNKERDIDKDGKLNFQEFFHGLFDLIRSYDEIDSNYTHESDPLKETPAKKLFDELDKDKDGFLSYEELLPVIAKLHPGEQYYAKQQADYIKMQADSNKDGRLSLQEMIENPYVFYSAIFSDEDDYEYHDEFR